MDFEKRDRDTRRILLWIAVGWLLAIVGTAVALGIDALWRR